jgi:hypothetical protein
MPNTGAITMKKTLLFSLLLVLASCSHKKETTAEAGKNLEDKWTPKVGSATKNEFIEEYGNPEWCKQEDSGLETRRFYRKKGTKWIGDKETKRDKKPIEQYDQVIADFDTHGVLKAFKSSAQR